MESFTDSEIVRLRALLDGYGLLPGLVIEGQLRVNQRNSQSAIFVDHRGAATAVQFISQAENPVLRLQHLEDRCCLELAAADKTRVRDAIDAQIGDVRSRQSIAHQVCIGRDPRQPPGQGALGGIFFVDPSDVASSPEFYWAIKMDQAEAIHVGNPERNQEVRLRSHAAGSVDVEIGGVLMMRIDKDGVRVRGPVKPL